MPLQRLLSFGINDLDGTCNMYGKFTYAVYTVYVYTAWYIYIYICVYVCVLHCNLDFMHHGGTAHEKNKRSSPVAVGHSKCPLPKTYNKIHHPVHIIYLRQLWAKEKTHVALNNSGGSRAF